MKALDTDGSWSPRAARDFSFERGLSLIDAAARACGVFDGRWVLRFGGKAVAVAIGQRRWLVYPIDSGWIATLRDARGAPDLDQCVRLRRGPGERDIPTAAWGHFLHDDLKVLDGEPAPSPTPCAHVLN